MAEIAAADERGLPVTKDETREYVYGAPYEDWKKVNQTTASPAQLAAFAQTPAGQNPHG